MALFRCPDCGKEYSSNAAACPNCGRPNNKKVSTSPENCLFCEAPLEANSHCCPYCGRQVEQAKPNPSIFTDPNKLFSEVFPEDLFEGFPSDMAYTSYTTSYTNIRSGSTHTNSPNSAHTVGSGGIPGSSIPPSPAAPFGASCSDNHLDPYLNSNCTYVSPDAPPPLHPKNKWIAFFLCLFTMFGHKLYERKYGMAILYFFTAGLFGIGYLVDLISLLAHPTTYYVK